VKSRSFTLIELVSVIVISALLGVAVMNFPDNSLSLARDQLMKDIRLTQTLALLDDKYLDRNTSESGHINRSKFWFKSFWQTQLQTSNNKIYYSVYSDTPVLSSGKYNFQPKHSEMYLNSLTRKYMTGNWKGDGLKGINKKEEVSTNLNLSLEFGITEVKYFFITSKTQGKINKFNIYFDNFGRPHLLHSKSKSKFNSTLHSFKYILQEPIQIRLKNSIDETCFNLEPISGYLHIESCIF